MLPWFWFIWSPSVSEIGRLRVSAAFTMPTKPCDMLRFDLERAGIDYIDDADEVFCFHALRVQMCTDMARGGASDTVAAMRHKIYQSDKQAAARARHALRDHEAHRFRGVSGIQKAAKAAADLDRMRTKHAWAEAFISLLDQPKKPRKAKP